MKKIVFLVALLVCAVIGAVWLRTLRSEHPEGSQASLSGGGAHDRGTEGVASGSGPPAAVRGASPDVTDRIAGSRISRELPVLPSTAPESRRDAILMLGATDEEVKRIARIELATQDALAEMGADLESEDDRYVRLLEIIAVERTALVEILGEERAALYSWLRAQEVEEEVLDLVGGLPDPLTARE